MSTRTLCEHVIDGGDSGTDFICDAPLGHASGSHHYVDAMGWTR